MLRAVAARRRPEGLAKYAGHLAVWGGGVHVGDAALRRLTELAPEQARRFIADDCELPSGALSRAIV